MDECSEIQGESALQRYGKKIQFLGTWGLYVQQMFLCGIFKKRKFWCGKIAFSHYFFNRPVVAGAVLQTPPSLTD